MLAVNPDDNSKFIIASRELTVENTTFCGAKCVMCPRDEYSRRWSHMSNEMFENVMDQAAELGITSLDLCGFGDPFMDPQYETKLRYSKAKYPHIRTYTSTTGHLLTPNKLPWICELFDTIKISLYGNSAESYEAIHKGVLKFDKIIENIDALLALPKGQRPHVILTYLIFPENEHEMDDWIARWKGRADEVLVWRPHNYGGSPMADELAYDTKERQEEQYRSCGRPVKGNPFVRTNGDVSVCCYDFNEKLTVGNFAKTSLLEVLQGQQLAEIRDIHERLAFKGCGKLCEGCDQIYDRQDALVYTDNPSRRSDQPTSHPDQIVRLTEVA
ncbi:radical SAM protein [Thalassospira sp. HF15]|uniref:radical SAM/SPASM domain-containing protein n=1 Tax=Thalassospira sp. HF15 TaxID=2722755 RepID=UPI0014311C4B|nr:radical SAM/SPASM domain-containing protein [Thalassospira sp. HF15]NIY75431.1 radical SAM protein [Thalassospira sp. HF15]